MFHRESNHLTDRGSGSGANGRGRNQIAAAHRSMSNWATGQLLSRTQEKPCAQCAGGGSPCPKCAAKKQHGQLESMQAELGPGQALDGSVRSRMQPLFGNHLSAVRVHTGQSAARLADRMDARAFAIGNHVAFGAGEYRPGTMAGDVLIAHELAHTAQQSGAAAGVSSSDALERDANRSAAQAARALWTNARHAAADLRQNAMPRLRSGLRLARCGRGVSIPGNTFGSWDIDQKTADGSGPGTAYSSDTDIWFNPNKDTVDCSEIAFVQAVRLVDKNHAVVGLGAHEAPRQTAAFWNIDRLAGRDYGWYGYNNDGTPSGTVDPGSSPSPKKDAKMNDKPGATLSDTVWSFETCAICRSGAQQNNLYACLTWGFDVDADSKLTKHVPQHHNAPSADFTASVGAWNAQAAGPAASRNSPTQQPLGPFN